MKERIKISNQEIKELIEVEPEEFPKYTAQILNLANQNAQGTRPKVVGQMSDLIQEFSGKTLKEWEEWYLERFPDAIQAATEKIFKMVGQLKDAAEMIDRNLVERWVRDLVIVKTFTGLKFQETILAKVAERLGKDYRLANPEEETKGIDGFIGGLPVSIKPRSYEQKRSLPESLEPLLVIFYEKKKEGLWVEFDPSAFHFGEK